LATHVGSTVLPTVSTPLIQPIAVYDALFQNAAILGLPFDSHTIGKSEQIAGIPESLQPTRLQLEITHNRWIDRLPFPKVRDNLINLHGMIDEEEFINDLYSPNSFLLTHPYDTNTWKVGKDFWKKWGYIFY
jgi:hypothetical protein